LERKNIIKVFCLHWQNVTTIQTLTVRFFQVVEQDGLANHNRSPKYKKKEMKKKIIKTNII